MIALHSIDVCVLFEPKTSGEKAISVASKLGFKNYHLEEASGYSGGIWLCWNDDATKLEVVLSTKQSVTAIITLNGQNWVLTIVYGSLQAMTKKCLWKLLDEISRIVDHLKLPWTIIDDFNEITNICEKKGGNMSYTNSGFSDCISRNSFFDMGFKGT